PLTIVISGVPGIGKSTLVQKLLCDWAVGEHHQRFAFIFLFKFRDLNNWREPTSLAEMIVKHHPYLNDLDGLRKILRKPENLMFIFDGLDESKANINFFDKHLQTCSNPESFTTISNIVTSLMGQTLLKGCSVVITSRPTVLESVDIRAVGRYTEIIGFLAEQRKIYFKQFFSDEKVSMKAFEYVQQNDILYTMCYNPSYCWILCSVLKSYFTKGNKRQQCPKTISQLFADFICNILTNHRRETDNPRDLLTSISKIALYGISNKRLVFDDREMDKFRIQSSQFVSGFMKEILQKEESFDRLVYTYLHLTVQEFLAALFPLLDTTADVTELLNEADCCKDGRFEILLRFLSGLCNTATCNKFRNILGTLSEESIHKVIDWLKTKTERELCQSNKGDLLNTLHCLYESQNITLIRSSVENQNIKLNGLSLNPVDYHVLSYILTCCTRMCKSRRLCGRRLSSKGQRAAETASSANFLIEEKFSIVVLLFLDAEFLLCVMCLAGNLNLLDLHLNRNKAGSEPVHLLQQSLTNPNKTFQFLLFKKIKLSFSLCDNLCACAYTNSGIDRIKFCSNNRGWGGKEVIWDGKYYTSCLSRLSRLWQCGLTTGCCRDLSSVLSTNSSLTELDLSRNKLGDSGLKLLSAGLMDPNCKLQTLVLGKCGLTAGCCRDLSSVLSTNSSLTELNLSENKLGDSGVKLLSAGLMDPNCNLQKL
uniref:NACHT domain-containing protein n=1 Tax=Latimeria chalumnae TaxID=7897 RepID=H2ZSA7_LATCH